MFSLIIVIVSIALVVALALATIYYGGKSADRAATRASASALISQATQIAAAGTLAESQGAGWPQNTLSFGQPYLSAMPVPPKSSYADTQETPDASHWEYYIPPSSGTASHHFVLKNKIARHVCLAVNKEQGVIGIPAVWDGKTLIQCFGPGVSARPDSAPGYTFFYDPAGTTPGQKEAALDQSKSEGGSSTPGYPRYCPDGSTIDSGLCPDTSPVNSGGSGGPGAPADKTNFGLVAVPGVLTIDGTDGVGDNYSSYCSSDMPVNYVTPQSTLTVGGKPASVDYIYEYGGSICVDSYGNPTNAPGSLPVVLSNPNGSTGTGTITYVEAFAPAPIVASMSPRTGPADVETRVTITGENFAPGVKVFLEYAKALPVTYISSTQIEVTIPKSTAVGFPTDYSATATVIIVNPDSDYASDLFDYVAVNGPPMEELPSDDDWKFVPGMTTQVLVTMVQPAYNDELGVQQGNFATYRAVKDCSNWPGIGEPTNGAAFCIPALKAEYLEWEGHTAQETVVRNGDDMTVQFGFVLSDGTHTYTFTQTRTETVTNNYLTFPQWTGAPIVVEGGALRVDCSTLELPPGYDWLGGRCRTITTTAGWGVVYEFDYAVDIGGLAEANPTYHVTDATSGWNSCSGNTCSWHKDATDAYSFNVAVRKSYSSTNSGMTLLTGVHHGPLGAYPQVPWSPDYGCSGYCNMPRND